MTTMTMAMTMTTAITTKYKKKINDDNGAEVEQ